MYKILNEYGENLRLALFENKYVSARYDLKSLNSNDLSALEDEIILLIKQEAHKIKEFKENKANTCHFDKINGEIRFIRPYILAQLLRLHNKIDYDSALPPEFFIKNKSLFMVNTVSFNVANGSTGNDMSGLERILYGLNVFQSRNLKYFNLVCTKEYSFDKESIDFIKKLNQKLEKGIITIEATEISEEYFDKMMFELIENLDPVWKKGTNGSEYTNINLKDNLKRFKNYFKIYD